MLPSRGEPCIFPGVMSSTRTVGLMDLISKHTTGPGFYLPGVTNAPWLIQTSVFASPNLVAIQMVPVLSDQSQTSTQITNMGIPTVLSKHQFKHSRCESVPVWAAVVLIWFSISSCMLHAVMKAIRLPIASMQHWLTVPMPYICDVEEVQPPEKIYHFHFLQFYQSSIIKLQTSHTEI